MDDNSRRRRQNEPPYSNSNSDPRFNTDQTRSFSNTSDRYRPAPITTSPAGGRGGATAYSGYYSEPTSSFSGTLPQNTMQYQATYPQDQRPQQNFSTYSSDIMYNVAPQSQQSSVYEAPHQFQTRQPAAMQMLSDVSAPYFPTDTTSAPGQPSLQHHTSTSSSTGYQQPHQASPSDRGSLIPQTYPSSITMGGMTQTGPELLAEEEFQGEGPGVEAAYTTYQTTLKEIFQNIISGKLSEASQSLLEISEWLLGHVGELGMLSFLCPILSTNFLMKASL